jgi:subtilase family serine protease
MLFLLALPTVSVLGTQATSSVAAPPPSLRGFRLVGTAPQSLPILVTFAIPLRNVAQLDTLVMQVSDPSSPEYRHFLTPEQARSEFLPTAQFDGLLSYLKAGGFQVEMTALDSVIVVEGTAGQFSAAFGGGINTYTNGTAAYYASSGVTTFHGAYLYATNGTYLFAKPAVATPKADGNVTFTSSSFPAYELGQVYNGTYYYRHGNLGGGQTIGLLDYYGSPTIASDLKEFDSTFGIPDTTLNIIPVGPYDPSLGANVGWSTEVALDAESSHAMAPGATIDMYVANGALPLSVPLAKIVQDDKVTTLSQSFGYPEWYYSQSYYLGGPGFLAVYGLLPDQYYALGSAEGITFLASTGDAGGAGYSAGPEGNLQYPATSPFVTAVGGTQTYFSQKSDGTLGFSQTAWSNIGFVPNMVNEGGGGGGVSILEPKPWYQSKQSTPPSYPNGRLNPDVSLQAGVDPATEIVDSGKVVGSGGTSESSPLLAGLLTLVAHSLNGGLGLINPLLYHAGNEAKQYAKGFAPITFGYIIPWKASYGFNLATGWGSPNVGELGAILNATSPRASLDIRGTIYNATGSGQLGYTQGQTLTVSAKIASAGTPVTTGSFTVELQTLKGTYSPTAMAYNAVTGNWTGSITMGQESGFAYVYLSGNSGSGVPGEAQGTIFAGYVGTLTVTGSAYSLPVDPWSWGPGRSLSLTVFVTDIKGFNAPAGSVTLYVQPYSIASNTYTNSSQITLSGTGTGAVDGYLSTPAPAGPLSLVLGGAFYGYAPLVYGIWLQSGYIYPSVAAEPGSVAPGQSLTIIANPIPPVNVYFETSFETGRQFVYDVYYGSNVTATLVSPTGATVSSATLAYQPCAQALRVCNGGASGINGQLLVPFGTAPGLYTVMLHASYGSFTPGGNLTGDFFGQVLVSGPMLEPSVSLVTGPLTGPKQSNASGDFFQGEPAHVVARITYSNSTTVTQGEFTAIVYPSSLATEYSSLMHTLYANGELVSLQYDPALYSWVGNVTLPSAANLGSLAGLGITSFGYSGPYDVYVTGISADGVPTDSALRAQQPFTIQPYLYKTGTVTSLVSGSQIAFSGATISTSVPLTGDVFIGGNDIKGSTLTISGSQIQGSLMVTNSNVTLVGVSGAQLVVNGSFVTIEDSTIGSLSIVGGSVTLKDSSYGTVSPALPTIQVSGLSKTIGGVAPYNVTVSGQLLSPTPVAAWVDGAPVSLSSTGSHEGTIMTGKLDAGALADGVHTLTITASQTDGLSSTLTTTFTTDAHQVALENQILYLFAFAVVLGLAALIIGVTTLRKRPALPPPPPAP